MLPVAFNTDSPAYLGFHYRISNRTFRKNCPFNSKSNRKPVFTQGTWGSVEQERLLFPSSTKVKAGVFPLNRSSTARNRGEAVVRRLWHMRSPPSIYPVD